MKAFRMIGQIILVALCVSVARAQVLGIGPCPNVSVVQNFDVVGYLGLWYQVARFPNPFESGDCATALYGPADSNGIVQVLNKEIVDGVESSIQGTAELADPESGEAKLIVKFGVEQENQTNADYWVLGTDYENFSVVFNCIPVLGDLFNAQAAWVLGREKPLSANATQAIEKILSDNNVDIEKFTVNDLPECQKQP